MRNTVDYEDWEAKENFRFAIEHEGRRYPVKKVVSMATSIPVSGFSGGDEANKFVTARGLTIVPIVRPPASSLRESLEGILAGYRTARTQPFAGHPIRRIFDAAVSALTTSEPVARRNVGGRSVKVIGSTGKGNWARVPWIAFLDSQETNTTQRGVYGVLLFREDMTGVYLTFNQGVTDPKGRLGRSDGLKQIRARAEELRKLCGAITGQGSCSTTTSISELRRGWVRTTRTLRLRINCMRLERFPTTR